MDVSNIGYPTSLVLHQMTHLTTQRGYILDQVGQKAPDQSSGTLNSAPSVQCSTVGCVKASTAIWRGMSGGIPDMSGEPWHTKRFDIFIQWSPLRRHQTCPMNGRNLSGVQTAIFEWGAYTYHPNRAQLHPWAKKHQIEVKGPSPSHPNRSSAPNWVMCLE